MADLAHAISESIDLPGLQFEKQCEELQVTLSKSALSAKGVPTKEEMTLSSSHLSPRYADELLDEQ